MQGAARRSGSGPCANERPPHVVRTFIPDRIPPSSVMGPCAAPRPGQSARDALSSAGRTALHRARCAPLSTDAPLPGPAGSVSDEIRRWLSGRHMPNTRFGQPRPTARQLPSGGSRQAMELRDSILPQPQSAQELGKCTLPSVRSVQKSLCLCLTSAVPAPQVQMDPVSDLRIHHSACCSPISISAVSCSSS